VESVRTGRAVVDRAYGKNVFEHFAERGEQSALFGQAMAAFSAALSQPLLGSYDFSAFRCIADIGGGTGRLLADILTENPAVRGILFDLPDVSAAATALLNASGVAKRCKLVGGSFFDTVPPGADAYLLKHILHDWDDARAIKILSNCRTAMARDATLLIVERMLPELAEQGRAAEAYLVDLEMLVFTPGGRERSAHCRSDTVSADYEVIGAGGAIGKPGRDRASVLHQECDRGAKSAPDVGDTWQQCALQFSPFNSDAGTCIAP
jgi:hypothetical protein